MSHTGLPPMTDDARLSVVSDEDGSKANPLKAKHVPIGTVYSIIEARLVTMAHIEIAMKMIAVLKLFIVMTAVNANINDDDEDLMTVTKAKKVTFDDDKKETRWSLAERLRRRGI